jgi:hypothetical protein
VSFFNSALLRALSVFQGVFMQEIITTLHRAAAAAHDPLVAFATEQLVGDIAHMDEAAFKEEFPRLAGMVKQVQRADARLAEAEKEGDLSSTEGWACEVQTRLEPVGHEVVALVLGGGVADEDAAALTAAKRQARKLGVPHTACV